MLEPYSHDEHALVRLIVKLTTDTNGNSDTTAVDILKRLEEAGFSAEALLSQLRKLRNNTALCSAFEEANHDPDKFMLNLALLVK